MTEEMTISQEAVDALYERLSREAKASGYNLNPDVTFTKGLIEGLLINEGHYGYRACPCRLAEGVREKDLDIICACDYRDEDLEEYGACYCALYVSDAVVRGEQEVQAIPERRPPEEVRAEQTTSHQTQLVPASQEEHEAVLVGLTWRGIPVWRCRVCGYLCARSHPPLKRPVCKADQDRFERFL